MNIYLEQKNANIYLKNAFERIFLDEKTEKIDLQRLVFDTTLQYAVSEKYVLKRIKLMVSLYSEFVVLDDKSIKKVV
jgi:hypothetical protein